MRTIGTNAAWTPDEDSILLRLVHSHTPWPEIFAAFPDRTDNACKTRANLLRHKMQAMPDPEEMFRQRWAETYGFRAYPSYKVNAADVPVFVRNYGVNAMTTGGVAMYG